MNLLLYKTFDKNAVYATVKTICSSNEIAVEVFFDVDYVLHFFLFYKLS